MTEQKLLKLTISKVNGPVFDGEAISVQVPGVDGEMEILADHAPLISPLKAGTLTVKKSMAKSSLKSPPEPSKYQTTTQPS